MSLFVTSSKLAIFFTILVFVLTRNSLTAEKVYVQRHMNNILILQTYFNKVFLIVTLFTSLRRTMTLRFPIAFAMASEAMVSIKRIEVQNIKLIYCNYLLGEYFNFSFFCQKFLLLDEMVQIESSERPPLNECQVDLKQVTVKWPAATEGEGNTLTDISFTAQAGQILAVVGQVGSGKVYLYISIAKLAIIYIDTVYINCNILLLLQSSLLNVILGELSPLQGSLKTKGKIAYASQEPWIFVGTIRQNILCGLEYDEERYNQVIQAAALERDLRLFPNGDSTAVGERGVQLSGGQKARVNLARCLYVDADIYLMDDPLSAVDTHVGHHLFDQAIKGFLRNKIRILATHQLQFLKDVDQILVLKGV